MFPPTHRIYRSIRPRNRFIIANKRRGLQTVSAICISLIFIIYGLETIYTMYDQYDFESQNFDDEKRRLPESTDDLYYELKGGAGPIQANARFRTRANDHIHFYSQDPRASHLSWQWFEQIPDIQMDVYQKEDAPPDFESQTYEYIPSLKKKVKTSPTPNVDEHDHHEIKKNAIFVAYSRAGINFPRYFYSLTDDQWWKLDREALEHDTFLPVDEPDEGYTIGYKILEVDHQAAEEAPEVTAEDVGTDDDDAAVTLISAPILSRHGPGEVASTTLVPDAPSSP